MPLHSWGCSPFSSHSLLANWLPERASRAEHFHTLLCRMALGSTSSNFVPCLFPCATLWQHVLLAQHSVHRREDQKPIKQYKIRLNKLNDASGPADERRVVHNTWSMDNTIPELPVLFWVSQNGVTWMALRSVPSFWEEEEAPQLHRGAGPCGAVWGRVGPRGAVWGPVGPCGALWGAFSLSPTDSCLKQNSRIPPCCHILQFN